MKSLARKNGLAFILTIILTLTLLLSLSACGEENKVLTDNNFDFSKFKGNFSLSEVQNLSNNPSFSDKLLEKDKENFSNPKIEVYQTNTSFLEIKNWFQNELPKLGWTDHSSKIVKADALNNNGWVLSFAKQDHVSGIMMLNWTTAQEDPKSILSQTEFKNLIPSNGGQYLLIVQTAIYNQNTSTVSYTHLTLPTKRIV